MVICRQGIGSGRRRESLESSAQGVTRRSKTHLNCAGETCERLSGSSRLVKALTSKERLDARAVSLAIGALLDG